MTVTQHTQYGPATGVGFTVLMQEITTEEWREVANSISAEHGGLAVLDATGRGLGFAVGILNEKGKIETLTTCPVEKVQEQVFEMAVGNGWVEDAEGIDPDPSYGRTLKVDLAQFDPWNLGYCFQIAAYGEEIVG